MNEPSAKSVRATSPVLTHGAAVLVINTDGQVQMANPAARQLWQASPGELVGENFPQLFTFEVVSSETGWVQSQWEVLLAAAQAQSISLQLQPKEAAPFPVSVRIEKAGENPAAYFAYISLPAPAAAPVTAPVTGPLEGLALLTDRGSLGFFDLNFLTHEAYYSAAWKRLLGHTDASLPNTYDSWLALIHPDDSAAAPDRQTRRTAVGPRSFSMEFRMKHAQGHYVWVQSTGVQIFGPNGALQRVLGVHLDINERKEFEEAGLRAEERLQQLSDRGRVGIFDLDFAGGLYWLSPGFKSLLGYTDAELPDTVESVIRTLPAEESAGGLQAYFLAEHPNQLAYFDTIRLRHRDGRDVLVHTGIVRQISRRKELTRVLGFILPPTSDQSKHTDANANISPEHFATLLSEVHEAVVLADAQGDIIVMNAKAEQMLAFTTAQVAGQPVWEIFSLVHRESGQRGESPVAKAITNGEATKLNNEFALDLGGGETRPISYSVSPVLGTDGQPTGAVLVFRDPDEMTLTPEELLRANRFEALGLLAGGIAHDYNNLLTTILGGISLAKDNRDYTGLDNSERACLAAKGLSKQLLSFAKGGAAVRQVVKPADFLNDAVRLAAAGSTVKVDVQVAPDLATVCVDRAQILQVFQNLIINAIQAMPTGTGRIWVNAANVALAEGQIAPLAAGNYIAIEVRDNGSGIKPEHLAKIFDPFFTTKKTGTGLGLATVLSIVKRHGGQMGIDTEVGVGTTFTVFLPPADQTEEVEARRAPSLRFGTGRVLFMDDDPEICALTGTMLESLGYKYDIARHGDEAIQLYKRYLNIGRPYDAVIMDLTIIGGMGGEQTFRALRDLDAEVRAIIASGYDNEDMARQFLDMGFCGYLTKPYRVGDLGRIIRTVLGK